MMIIRHTTGLKCQHILAQGNPEASGRPGLEKWRYNRLRDNVHKGGNLISDEGDDLLFPGNDDLQFRPKGIIGFVHRILSDVYSPISPTQGGVLDRSSRNYALG
jgi:hypothetical protein